MVNSSCSFVGPSAGGLSVTVAGSVKLVNVTNKARVIGDENVGGFIGFIENLQEHTTLILDSCTNEGSISVNNVRVGGFVGAVKNNKKLDIVMSNCTNDGVINDKKLMGGMVGIIAENTDVHVTLSSCINKGNLSGEYTIGGMVELVDGNRNGSVTISNSQNMGIINGTRCVSGFIGKYFSNTNLSMSILNCVNDGDVSGNNDYVGGLIGSIEKSEQMAISISHFINNGNITGESGDVGGFVGIINASIVQDDASLEVSNSENNGLVSSSNGLACGLFCVEQNEGCNLTTTVVNTINKGNVSSENAFGITNIITNARNVVSMGVVAGQPPSSTFWNAFTNVDLFYGLSGECFNCSAQATQFQHNTNTGTYNVFGSQQFVHDLLNYESVKQQYGMVWTRQLDLVYNPVVIVAGLVNDCFIVKSGTLLGDIESLSHYFDDGVHGFVSGQCDTRIVYNSSFIVTESVEMRLGLFVGVTVGSPINEAKRMVVGDTLQHASCLFGFLFDDFIVVDSVSSGILNQSFVIETDMALRLCHNVSVSGLMNESWVIEHGTKLSQIGQLSGFFVPQFIIYDLKNKSVVHTNDSLVMNDMRVVISNKTKQEISIRFDDLTKPTADDIKKALDEVLSFGDDEHVWIEIIAQDDGSFVISVIQSGGKTNDVADALLGCSKSKV